MNPDAFAQNRATASRLCARLADRIKYLFWLYDIPWRVGLDRARTLDITFDLDPPLGRVKLAVRCNNGSDAFIFSEVFEHRYYDFDLPAPPTTILDVGANAGFTAVFFGRKYPSARLACVEPMPGNVALLRKNIRANDISALVYPNALSISNGIVAMEIATSDYGHRVADIEFGQKLQGEILHVPAITVSTLMTELGWGRINLLKLDIEGYEGVLLRQNCDWLERVDSIAVECHGSFGERELLELSARFGFLTPRRLPGVWLVTRAAEPKLCS